MRRTRPRGRAGDDRQWPSTVLGAKRAGPAIPAPATLPRAPTARPNGGDRDDAVELSTGLRLSQLRLPVPACPPTGRVSTIPLLPRPARRPPSRIPSPYRQHNQALLDTWRTGDMLEMVEPGGIEPPRSSFDAGLRPMRRPHRYSARSACRCWPSRLAVDVASVSVVLAVYDLK